MEVVHIYVTLYSFGFGACLLENTAARLLVAVLSETQQMEQINGKVNDIAILMCIYIP